VGANGAAEMYGAGPRVRVRWEAVVIRKLVVGACLLSSVPAVAQDLYDPGEQIQKALSAQITRDGLDQLSVVAAEMVPALLGEDLLDLGTDELDLFVATFSNLEIGVSVNDVELVPVEGPTVLQSYLGINVDATLELDYDVEALFGLCSGAASAEIDATLGLQISIVVRIDPATQERFFDAEVDLPPNGIVINQTRFSGACATAGNIVGGLLGGLVGLVQQPIEDALADLEPTLEDALNQAKFVDTIELLGTELSIEIVPQQVLFTDGGMELIYSSTVSAPHNTCIDAFDPGGSLRTNTDVPLITSNPPGTQVAANLSDDMVNQIMYAAFEGGLLCFTVDDNAGLDLPIALDSGLLSLLGGEGFEEIIGEEPKPLVIKTLPKEVPEVVYGGAHDVGLKVRRLGLGFFTEVDYRMARAVAMEVDVDAGVDFDFDATTGTLALNIALDPADFNISVVPDVLVRGSEQAMEEGVEGLVGTLLDTLLGDALSATSFVLPAIEGLGVTSLAARPAGAGDWLALDVELGAVTYGVEGAGCDSEGGCAGGCDSSSCDSGCSTARLNLGGYLVVFVPFWLLRRRR
jgi:hypothetical protein